ncbi:ESCRT-0 subunit protein hse1, partial [Ascosphaera atra]
MFRASQISQFDEPVAKATDENLTSENWEYILVCEGRRRGDLMYCDVGRDVVAAVERRLLYPNANTQLYSLEQALRT